MTHPLTEPAATTDQRTDDALAWLTELLGDAEGWIHGATLDRSDGGRWEPLQRIREGMPGLPGTATELLPALARSLVLEADAGREVFLCPYRLRGSHVRENGRSIARRHVHADVDGPVDLATVRYLGGMAVASGSTAADGSPHGHVYMRLTESVPGHMHAALCRAVGQYVGGEHHDTSKVGDGDVLRPPGTLNHKGDRARPVAWLIRPDDRGVRTWAPERLAGMVGLPWPVPEEPDDAPLGEASAQSEGRADREKSAAPGTAARRVDGLVREVETTATGNGNRMLNRAAGICAALCASQGEGGELDPSAIRERLVAAYLARPLPLRETARDRDREARATVASGWRWGERNVARALEDRRGDDPMTHEEHLTMTEHGTDEEPADDPAASWRAIDLRTVADGLRDGSLERPRPTVGAVGLAPEDGPRALLYRGKVNGLAGESNAGKSWTALVIARQELESGEGVLYLDLEDDGVAMTDRLLQMGADLDQVAERFAYVNPGTRFDTDARAALLAILDRLAPSLVVIDSVGEALSLEGMRPNEDDEVARWFRLLPRWLAGHACEPAVLVLDHVPKVDGGLWPIGSQRKRAAVTGAQYMQERRAPFSQRRAGYSALKVAKDRHGAYGTGETAAHLVVTPGEGGVTVDLVSGTPSAQALTTADPVDRAVAALDRWEYACERSVRGAWEYLTERIPPGSERPRKSDVEKAQKLRQERVAEGSK